MSTARERLSLLRKVHLGTDGRTISERPTETTIYLECAVEITDAVLASEHAINDMANRMVTVSNNMIGAIDKAREQMEVAARESTKAAEESIRAAQESANAAKESAKLSGQLNTLTRWIMAATVAAALAAITQAWVAVYNAQHPQQTIVQIATPSGQVSPPKQ